MAVVAGNWSSIGQLNATSITKVGFNVGTRDIIIVGAAWAYNVGKTCTGVTCGGVGLTGLTMVTDATNQIRGQFWYLAGPPTSTQDVVASFSGVTDSAMFICVDTGADQSAPVRDSNGSTGTTTHPDTTVTSAVGDLIHNLVIFYNTPTFTSWDSGQTARGSEINSQGTFGGFRVDGSSVDGSAGSVPLNSTISASVLWVALGMSVRVPFSLWTGEVGMSGGMQELTAGMAG